MGAFWGGFAAKGVEYIDEARKNALDKTKLDEARKFETTEWDRRNSINRKEKLDDENRQDIRENYFKPERITEENGTYWFSKLEEGPDGNLVWTREPASTAQVNASKRALEVDNLSLETAKETLKGKKLSNQRELQNIGLDAAEFGLRREESRRKGLEGSQDAGRLPDSVYNARKGLAEGGGSFTFEEYTRKSDGKRIDQKYARELARIAENPSHPHYKRALEILMSDILPYTTKTPSKANRSDKEDDLN